MPSPHSPRRPGWSLPCACTRPIRDEGPGRNTRSIDEILAAARARLDRVEPEALEGERTAGAVIVDIRPVEQRTRDGDLPGAIVIDRNVLEWRLDPACEHHVAEVAAYDARIVIVCNEGYQSSLAAALLRDVGLHRSTDLVGGFQAWLKTSAARLVRPSSRERAVMRPRGPRFCAVTTRWCWRVAVPSNVQPKVFGSPLA